MRLITHKHGTTNYLSDNVQSVLVVTDYDYTLRESLVSCLLLSYPYHNGEERMSLLEHKSLYSGQCLRGKLFWITKTPEFVEKILCAVKP